MVWIPDVRMYMGNLDNIQKIIKIFSKNKIQFKISLKKKKIQF